MNSAFSSAAEALERGCQFMRRLLDPPFYIVGFESALEGQILLPYALRRVGESNWWILLNGEFMPLGRGFGDGPYPGPENDKEFPELHIADPRQSLPQLADGEASDNLVYLYGNANNPLLDPVAGEVYLDKLGELLVWALQTGLVRPTTRCVESIYWPRVTKHGLSSVAQPPVGVSLHD